MAILLNNHGYGNDDWQQELTALLPDTPVYVFPDVPDPNSVEYALVWDHPHGDLANYPNLKAILVLGAGTEHLDTDPLLPNVPVIRLIDPAVVTDMALYTLYWVTHFHRRFEDYRAQSQQKVWRALEVCANEDLRVSILGLGAIGAKVAEQLVSNGYQVNGWNRSNIAIEGMQQYQGDAELEHVLANSDILVNCLPLTTETYHLLDHHRLSQLPVGAHLINIARGASIDDQALLTLLDNGHISGAALDAFVQEPLPADDPFWSHPRVHVTPHIAGNAYPRSTAKVLVANIQRIEANETPFPIHVPPQHTSSPSTAHASNR